MKNNEKQWKIKKKKLRKTMKNNEKQWKGEENGEKGKRN